MTKEKGLTAKQREALVAMRDSSTPVVLPVSTGTRLVSMRLASHVDGAGPAKASYKLTPNGVTAAAGL